jgi:predicted phage terminase large subunit-like protein
VPLVELSPAEVEAELERRRRGEQIAEEAARLAGDLRAFIRAAWHVLEPATEYRHGWHIDAIAEHLDAAYRREIRRLAIFIPPRHMKSLTVSVFGPAWRWTTVPAERFLTASYGEPLATDHAKKTRDLIQSAWYRARWGHVYQLVGDQNVKRHYENNQRGYRFATSVGGQGTGFGGDVIVIDDPHNAQEADRETDADRKAVLEWHDGTVSTRFNDPKTGVEVLVMQRLHQQDLAGHVLDKGGWTTLTLPARYEPRLMVQLPSETVIDLATPAERTLASGRVLQGDPRTEEGELLWPGHVPAEELATIEKDLGPVKAPGQLQQRPAAAEGRILKRFYWRYYRPDLPPTPALLVQSWDTSFKDKKTSDWVVGQVWGAMLADRYLYRAVRGQMGLVDAQEAVLDLDAWCERRFPNIPRFVLIENRANGPEIIAEVRKVVAGVIPVDPEGDKIQRAEACTPELAGGNVYLPGWLADDQSGPDEQRTPGWVLEHIGESSVFPAGANDDRVDAMTQALRWLRGKRPGKPAPPPAEDRPREASAGVRDMAF